MFVFLDYFLLSLGLLPNPIYLYRYHIVLSTVLSLAVFNNLKMLLFFLIPWFSILCLKSFLSFVHFTLYSFFLYSLHFNESIILYYIIFFQLNSLLYIFYYSLVVSLDYHINSWIIESNINYYLYKLLYIVGGFLGGSDGKESACHAGDPGSIPGLERPPGKKMATHSSVLAWRIPWREEPKWSAVHGVKESDTTEELTHTQTHMLLDH